MTMDDAIEAFAHSDELPIPAIQWVLDEWDSTGPICRALLHRYVGGDDLSERTEQALYVIAHLLAEKADTASFPDLCHLAMDPDRAGSVFGEDGGADILACLLVSTFDGNVVHLHRLVETPTVDELIRGDALLALAYLARTRRIAEAELYDYLAALPDRLQPEEQGYVWFGWARAIAALGFAGLSSRVEQVFQRRLIDPTLLSPSEFWLDLREGLDDPHGISGGRWGDIGPVDNAVEWLASGARLEDGDDPAQPEPVRNPLRHVGRNDPCPCGSGKKYKKCCLAA